ncbi:unnamed protein product [Ectocarpus fasciculatus]
MNVGAGSMAGAGVPRESSGAGGAGGGQGSSKRPRVSGASGNGNTPGGSGADGGGSSPAGSAAVGNGNSNGGGGGGAGGSSTRSGGGVRSGTPSQPMEEAPPMPPSLNTGMSQMIVTRPGTGGEGAPRRGLGDRGPSFGFGAMPSFAEGGGGGGAGGGAPGGAAPSAGRLAHERSLPGVTDPAEVNVFFILAKGYLSHELGMLGFPAYDRSQILLGFYKEVQSTAGQTQVVFIPAQRIPNLDERDTQATTEILREEMRKGSQSIISYENCNGSLSKMREDAFMYYWSKSMIIDMESNEAPEQQGSV